MSSRSAVRLKALDQARQKLEDQTKQDVVTFTFIISEEGAEMMGEGTLTNEAMALFEEHGIMELATIGGFECEAKLLHTEAQEQRKLKQCKKPSQPTFLPHFCPSRI